MIFLTITLVGILFSLVCLIFLDHIRTKQMKIMNDHMNQMIDYLNVSEKDIKRIEQRLLSITSVLELYHKKLDKLEVRSR